MENHAFDPDASPSFNRLEITPGRFLHYLLEGPETAPFVLFDAGAFGIYADGWWVKEALKDRYRVCLYDRAGMGWSDPPPKGALPDPEFHVEDMRRLVTALGGAIPFVLIGHSMAGIRLHTYANLYPQDLKGMILIDALSPDQLTKPHIKPVGWLYKHFLDLTAQAAGNGFGNVAGPLAPNMFKLSGVPRADKVRSYTAASHYRAAADEVAAVDLSADYWHTNGAVDLPLAILSSTIINGHTSALTQAAQNKTGYGFYASSPMDSHTSILRGKHAKRIGFCVDEIEDIYKQNAKS